MRVKGQRVVEKFLLIRFFHRVRKLSEKMSGCDQLWRVCYVTNVKNFENLGLSLLESDLNNVLDLFFELVLLKCLKDLLLTYVNFGYDSTEK